MCYNPKRKEFESIEYDYQAEMMLADLEFNDNDSPEETQLKCRLVEEYSRRLKERYVRREFVVEYKLLDHYNGVKSPYEEEDLLLLPFMRFTDNQKRYSRLVRKYAEHRKLRRLLAGIKKIKDAGSLIIQVQETNAEAADPLIVGTKFDAKTIAWHNTLA